MPANKNALLRYKTLDRCLSNKYRRYAIADLVEACDDALVEYEGIYKGVSERTVRMDLAMMRSDKLGYNAPIEVYDGKYYRYSDPDYSINKLPLTADDIEQLNDAVNIISQYADFGFLNEISDIMTRLDNYVHTYTQKRTPRVLFESNAQTVGLKHISPLYKAVTERKGVSISYRPFSGEVATFNFSPYFIKEYQNRWFVVGKKEEIDQLSTLALDRIVDIQPSPGFKFDKSKEVDPVEYYANNIGVSVNLDDPIEEIIFEVEPAEAAYVQTKPFHRSQKTLGKSQDGWTRFSLTLRINMELIRQLRTFGPSLRIITPNIQL